MTHEIPTLHRPAHIDRAQWYCWVLSQFVSPEAWELLTTTEAEDLAAMIDRVSAAVNAAQPDVDPSLLYDSFENPSGHNAR
ncbi:hypothetical protein [Ruania halotolerans]|uniref:hypothetical protein n=1 Tax=Ruania halotolerans TaxID=2897773 RepID=UPI001E54AA86|nr:hypothetical protein [Ruania halotolerans]UFU05504.1 hypothetical protein LQF10_13750 [Ruania halotolerans]